MEKFSQEDRARKITLKVGDEAPAFTLENQDGVMISLKDFLGKRVILYFYPKDGSPGCTKEAKEFSENYDNFLAKNTVLLGISPDSTEKHAKFIADENLYQILLSDKDKEVSKLYGVLQVRKNFGKEYLGLVRSTFLIGKDGKIEKIYKSVKVAEHAKKVLTDLEKISS